MRRYDPPEVESEPSPAAVDGELEPSAAPAEVELAPLSDQLEQHLEQLVQTTVVKLHRGPLPSAEVLRDYEDVLSGLADRVVTMAEREQAHRHAIDREEARLPFRLAKRGQTFGLAAVVLVLVFAAYLVHSGSPVAGSIVAGLDLVGLVTVFVTGQRADNARDAQQKAEPNEKGSDEGERE